MTKQGKTFKDLKEVKGLSQAYKAAKEGQRVERGGHKNLLRETLEEEAAWSLEEVQGLIEELDGIVEKDDFSS